MYRRVGGFWLSNRHWNTPMIGVWRIEQDGHYALKGLMDDPIVTAAAEQAKRN